MPSLSLRAVRGVVLALAAFALAATVGMNRCAGRDSASARRPDEGRPGRPSERYLVRVPRRPEVREAQTRRIIGVVVDVRGEAVAGAAVEIRIGTAAVARTESDREGGFVLEVVGMAGARVGVAAREGSRSDHR